MASPGNIGLYSLGIEVPLLPVHNTRGKQSRDRPITGSTTREVERCQAVVVPHASLAVRDRETVRNRIEQTSIGSLVQGGPAPLVLDIIRTQQASQIRAVDAVDNRLYQLRLLLLVHCGGVESRHVPDCAEVVFFEKPFVSRARLLSHSGVSVNSIVATLSSSARW